MRISDWSSDVCSSDLPTPLRSFGRLVAPGEYRTSVTRPAMFADYLTEQLTLLMEDYDIEVEAVAGRQEIPFPYVIDPGNEMSLRSEERRVGKGWVSTCRYRGSPDN